MHYPHGVLGHDGYSLDGQHHRAGDTVTVVDGGESDSCRDALLVLNNRSGSQMLIARSSVSWFTSFTSYVPGPQNLDQILSLQWNQSTAPKQAADSDDFSDGSLSTGQSNSSISSPTTPLTSLNPLFAVRRDSAVDVSSPEGTKEKKDTGFDDVLGITAARSCVHRHPLYAPSGQSIPASPTGLPDEYASLQEYTGMYYGASKHVLIEQLPTNDVQVNYMYIPSPHESHQSTQSPATQSSPDNQSNPLWGSFVSAPDASWQGSPARPGDLAPEMTGHMGYHQHGQQASGSDFARTAHNHSHPPQFTNPQYGLPEQGSFSSQSYGANMQHIAAHHGAPVFYRTQEHQTMNLSTPGTQYYSPSLPPYNGRPIRTPTAATTSRAADPEPPAPKEFRPDLVLDAFRHQVRPHIDVLGVQRAQRNALEDQAGAERISKALRLAQSTVDDTIGVLETLRPSSTVGQRTNKRLREEHVEHILSGIQCVRQSALDGRELAAKDRENLAKQLESLRSFVKTLERIDKTIVVSPARDGRSVLSTNNISQVAATAGHTVPESDESTMARPTSVTTGMTSCHWVEGQTTPPPDQPSASAAHYGQHDAMRQQTPSRAVNARQAVPEPGMHVTAAPPLMLSSVTTSPSLESSGHHLEPAQSTLASSVMASTLAPTGVSSPVAVPGWTSQLHPGLNLSPQQHSEPGHMGPALYPSPPQAGYGALPARLAAHSPAGPSPVQNSVGMPLPVYGSATVQLSPYVGPTAGPGPSPDGLLLPGSVVMVPSVSAPGTFALHADHHLSVGSPMDSGRRGSVPERRLPHRERNRAAPYPMDYRSSGGRKGSV